MDVIQNVIFGFQVALQPINLIYCFFGVLIGTLVGVLPGLGPPAAIALLLPATFKVTPVSAIIILAGIYYGAMYGGSTTSILVNIPGEAASVVTCLDGYKMARKGRAGPALGIAAFGSFIAGTFAVIALTLVGPFLAGIALKDWADSIWAIIRGTILGFFLGIIPGGGAIVASFASYAIEKKVSKHPEEFGKGAIAGVAGPESANNAAAGGSFIPLLTLGIPANAVMAIFLGALMIHGLQPGPLLMKQAPDLFWGTIVSMYIGNGMLLVLNLPLIPLWIMVLRVPYYLLYPLIILFCLIGAYSIGNNAGDVIIMLIFGIVGYLMRKFRYDGAPMVLALVLGPMLEEALRQSLILSRGNFSIFVSRPISLGFLVVAVLLLIVPIITQRKKLSILKE